MTDPEVLKTHARLFDRMGQTMGLDLEEEAVRGRLRFEEIAEAVLRCTRCTCSGICDRKLAGLEGRRPDHAPDYCRNGDLLSYLQTHRAVAAE